MVSVHSVIGYNGGHYINYSRKGQFWYKFDDSHYHEIGVFKDMLSDMAEGKVLPYFVVYKVESK